MKRENEIVLEIVFALAMLALVGVGCTSAATHYVNSGESIQATVDVANPGDIAIVRDGTYTENVNVNKRLTIRSEHGAASTIVNALDPDVPVFEVTANHVTISGFTVTGSSAGIYVDSADYCTISDNNASNFGVGIYLVYSSNNVLTSNTASNNIQHGIGLVYSSNNVLTSNTASNNKWEGILLWDSNKNTLTSNTASNNYWGIHLRYSSKNTLTGNTASNNNYGIHLYGYWSNYNTIYNNYFNNRNNAYDYGNNIWNTTKTAGPNIIGGPYLGGNYWSDYVGTDTDGDGLGDTLLPYNQEITNGGDWHPLVSESELPDLTLSPSDITFSNPNPAVGETVTITATIHNIGNADATDVIVQFFDGDPDTGGTQIGDDRTIASINAGGTGTVQVDWTTTAGSHDIYVIVDPYDDIPESDENNNEAHITCVIEPGQPNVVITDISASPDPVSPGDTVTITVDTRNDGAADFANVSVTVWGHSGDYLCNLRWQGYNFDEDETSTFSYQYIVPDDAELGSYDIGAGAWDDCTGTCEGQCCPDGLCSGPHNDGLIRYGVFEVEVLPGSLTVTVKNAAGKSLPDCGGTIDVVLFDKDYIYIKTESKTYSGGESSVQVQFDNLANEQHFIEVYHIPNSDLKLGEFWGCDEVTVSGSTPKDFVRHTQVVYDVKINGESPYGNEIEVNAEEQVHVDLTVKNFEDGTSANNVKVRLILDQDKSSPYYFDETQGGSIPQNGEKDFGFDCTLEEAGIYYFYIVVRGEYDEYIVVDQHDWYKAVVASELPNLGVVDMSISPINPKAGETVTIRATVENTGAGNAGKFPVVAVYSDELEYPPQECLEIETQIIDSMVGGGSEPVQMEWKLGVIPGHHAIYVMIVNLEFPELDEDNNYDSLEMDVVCDHAPDGVYVPLSKKALILAPYHWDGFIEYSDDLVGVLKADGWQVNYKKNDEVTIDALEDWLNADYGLIHITTHGHEDGGFAIESFYTEAQRNARRERLKDKYTAVGVSSMFYNGIDSNRPSICVNDEFIRTLCNGLEQHPLVYFEACSMGLNDNMREAFLCEGAGAYLGFDKEVLFCQWGSCDDMTNAEDVSRKFYAYTIDYGYTMAEAVDKCPLANGEGCGRSSTPCVELQNYGNGDLILVEEVQTQIKGYVFYDDGTTPLPHANEIPVYIHQEGVEDPIWQGRTNSEGYYICDDLTQHWDPDKTKKFRIEAKWENDIVKIHDFALIGSEVIRERRPESGYDKIPQDGMWEDIVFDDGDAARDYDDASVIFEAINDASNYIKTNYEYNPNQVGVYIHDWTTDTTCTSWIDGAIHFSTNDEEDTHSVSYHEYGHAIHFQHGAGLRYPRKMQEGWAIYFESLFHDDRYAGDYLESNEGYCLSPFNSRAHDWGIVYARIFHDLYDDVNSGEFDNFDNGENRIWQTFMDDKVKTIDEFYNNFIENPDEREAVRSIYATKKIRAPDYNGNFINVDFPDDINPGDVAIIDFTVKNYATSEDSYDVILSVWDFWEDNFCFYGYQENGEYFKRIDIDKNSEFEGDFKGKVDVPSSSGLYRILLAIVPVNWFSRDACCLDFDDYDNGWIHYKSIVQTITLNSDLSVIGECPIDLEIVDPDGFTINKQSNEITDATYSEVDINVDGDPDDIIIIPDRKIGDYTITVIPEHYAKPTDTYTLKVSAGDTTIVLAEDIPISDIPDQPYIIRSTEECIIQIIPATVRIEPETLNLGSKGVFTAYIQLPDGHDVSDITISTVECEGAPAIEGKIVHGGEGGHHGMGHIGDTLKVKSNRQELVAVPTGDPVKLTVTGKVLHNGEEVDFEGSDTIRVIDKGKGK